jgi:hypothetical protein
VDILRLILLITHFIGMAAIIGAFIAQMRRPEVNLAPMLTGAIVQLVTGFGLVATRVNLDLAVGGAKIAAKLIIAVLVLGAVIGGLFAQRRGATRAVKPFFRTAGALAIVNVIVAVAWV